MLVAVGDAPGPLRGRRLGLYHLGWKVGDSKQELQNAYNRALENGSEISGMSDHRVSKSLYLTDPDGNEVELYVDDPTYDWRNENGWLREPVQPLRL
jgi:catechol 2,3-dioxygenase